MEALNQLTDGSSEPDNSYMKDALLGLMNYKTEWWLVIMLQFN